MSYDILHRAKVKPAFWGVLLEMSAAKNKPGMDEHSWAKDYISKAELKAVAVYDGRLYRPFYEINHPKHKLGYLMDFESAQAVLKAWNKMTRPKHDRIEAVPVLFSCKNNTADYRK